MHRTVVLLKRMETMNFQQMNHCLTKHLKKDTILEKWLTSFHKATISCMSLWLTASEQT